MLGSEQQRSQQFEQIGLQQKLFSRPQLSSARQEATHQGIGAGELLVDQGVLSRDQLRGLERAVTYRIGRDEDKEIAKVIVDSQYCGQDAVESALKRQKEFYGKTGELLRLGALLVEGNELTESQKIAAYKIHGIERSSPSGSSRRGDGR